jgi:transcriptional regulator GlxA family with amidase domain
MEEYERTQVHQSCRGIGDGMQAKGTMRNMREQSKRIRRIAAVCTGVYGIAPSGVLDGRRVTTHWRFASDLATRFPEERDSNASGLADCSR